MSEIFAVIGNIFDLAFTAIPENWFVVVLPFVAGVGIISFIKKV